MLFKASAPGSLMLLGEYAVLYGKHALVCAVDKRMTVLLTPRQDDKICITSTLGHYETTLSALTIEKPFQFILASLKQYHTRLRNGCDIEVKAEFSDQVGLGSSAAVTVATLAAIMTWLSIKITPLELLRQGRQVVHHVQGVGSGADVAASVYGGMLGYQTLPLTVDKISMVHELTVFYSGYKTPTVEAIKQVQDSFATRPQLLRSITSSIGQCASEGIQLARKGDWQRLGEVMTIQQGLMESLGVCTGLLRQIVDGLREQVGIVGAKISGSGLGDCVVGLGKTAHTAITLPGVMAVPVAMTLQGVICEKS